jgi:hypothetical protein
MVTAHLLTATGPETVTSIDLIAALAEAVRRHLGEPDALRYVRPDGSTLELVPDLGIETADQLRAWADAHGSPVARIVARRV